MEILPFHLLTCGFSIIESKWSLSLGQGHMWADNLQNMSSSSKPLLKDFQLFQVELTNSMYIKRSHQWMRDI